MLMNEVEAVLNLRVGCLMNLKQKLTRIWKKQFKFVGNDSF